MHEHDSTYSEGEQCERRVFDDSVSEERPEEDVEGGDEEDEHRRPDDLLSAERDFRNNSSIM